MRGGSFGQRISIHALREEGDLITSLISRNNAENFYPRPPRGGRLPRIPWRKNRPCNFYPRPPRGGRPGRTGAPSGGASISIHALREEGDAQRPPRCWRIGHFYPRPPRGGRLCRADSGYSAQHFYPRPPRGGRHALIQPAFHHIRFLSTPSARRATFFGVYTT